MAISPFIHRERKKSTFFPFFFFFCEMPQEGFENTVAIHHIFQSKVSTKGLGQVSMTFSLH